MSWSRKDIIADIEKNQKIWEGAGYEPIDIDLPYWELRNAYTQQIYHISIMGHSNRSMALCSSNTPPPDTQQE